MAFFPYRFDPGVLAFFRPLGLRRDRDGVRVSAGELSATFGFLNLTTPVSNVVAVSVTGPYRWYRALGPRLSLVDHGLTFGTTSAMGVCIQFAEPLQRIVGPWAHPAVTLTVADPDELVAAIGPVQR